MPTKHIDEKTWRKVEEHTVKAVVETKRSIKDTEMLKFLIEIGAQNISEDDYQRIIKKLPPRE